MFMSVSGSCPLVRNSIPHLDPTADKKLIIFKQPMIVKKLILIGQHYIFNQPMTVKKLILIGQHNI